MTKKQYKALVEFLVSINELNVRTTIHENTDDLRKDYAQIVIGVSVEKEPIEN